MISAVAGSFIRQLRQVTPRERAGLAILAAIATWIAAFYAIGWMEQSTRSLEAAAQTRAESEALRASYADEGYRRQLASTAGNVWRWSRTADALASEEILAELESLGLQAGFADATVTMVAEAPARGRVKSLEISLSAGFDWNSFLALLEAFESSELSLQVRSIDVSEVDGAQRMTLVIAVPLIDARETP